MDDKPTFVPQDQYAFPHSVVVPDGKGGHYYSVSGGMTQRDYFAAAALTGLLAKGTPGGAEWYAQQAYEYADAMLAAGKVGP